MKVFALIAALIAASACEKEAPTIQARSAPADPSEFYTVTANATQVAAGTPSAAGFEIHPKSGWKINEEYPWKFEVQPVAGVTVAAPTLDKAAMTLSAKAAKVPFDLTANAGAHTLVARGRLSICNPDACHNFQNQEITFTVEAK